MCVILSENTALLMSIILKSSLKLSNISCCSCGDHIKVKPQLVFSQCQIFTNVFSSCILLGFVSFLS